MTTGVTFGAGRGAEDDEILGDGSVNDEHGSHRSSGVVPDPFRRVGRVVWKLAGDDGVEGGVVGGSSGRRSEWTGNGGECLINGVGRVGMGEIGDDVVYDVASISRMQSDSFPR